MGRAKRVVAVLALSLLAMPAASRAEEAACQPGKVIGAGKASWYGADFQGEKDARGKHFNMNGLTAAHRTLPLNSFVQVTNRRNHRKVVVKITDRGPYAKGRIIDVSKAAAVELGMTKRGVASVSLRACERTPARERKASSHERRVE